MTLFTLVAIATLLCFIPDHISAQDINTCVASSNCDEFRACCEKSCPSGATPICHSEVIAIDGTTPAPVAKTTAKSNRGENAFMAGGAAPEADAPAQSAPASSGGETGRIAGAQCLCNDQKSFVVSMSMACLTTLDAPDKCGEFEKCCKESCSKHVGNAHLCGQERDGSASSDTECTCFNSLAHLPGWDELEKSKDGGAGNTDEKGFEDHNEECFNTTDSCQAYTDCCLEACKKLEYTGVDEPLRMCVGNKYGQPMKSTHTFCRCPRTTAVFGIQLWSEGGGKQEDVASVFKGGDDSYYDTGVSLAPFAMLIYLLIVSFVVLGSKI